MSLYPTEPLCDPLSFAEGGGEAAAALEAAIAAAVASLVRPAHVQVNEASTLAIFPNKQHHNIDRHVRFRNCRRRSRRATAGRQSRSGIYDHSFGA